MALQEELKTQGDFLFKHRSFLPLIILVIGLSVFGYGKYNGQENLPSWLSGSYKYICLGIALLGLMIRIFTVGHTPKGTSGRNTKKGQRAYELNSTGIYSTVRHPLYLGNFFMWLGVAMLTENAWFIVAFILFYAFYYERIMYAEENFLRNKFGQEYLTWAEDIPAIIPSFKNYSKPKYPFSIKKVLKKEKNGFCAVFLLFWVFEVVGNYIKTQEFELIKDYWFYGAIISFVIYLILKVIKKLRLLDEIDR